jgi:hypothetical protein
MGGACSPNGGKEEVYRLLVGNPEGKRPLGRPRRRWMDNIKMKATGKEATTIIILIILLWIF